MRNDSVVCDPYFVRLIYIFCKSRVAGPQWNMAKTLHTNLNIIQQYLCTAGGQPEVTILHWNTLGILYNHIICKLNVGLLK